MRKYLLAAVAAAAIATPAYAQSSGPYVGLEGGILFPKDTNVDADVNFIDPAFNDVTFDNVLDVDYKRGWDLDLIGGYDFGAVDWEEFYAVVRGEGPVAKERMTARREAWEKNAWVREAAAAHEAKKQARKAA